MEKYKFNYMTAAQTMAQKGEFESALHYYFLESYNKHSNKEKVEIMLGIANAYIEMGIIDEAIRHLMRAYAISPRDEDILSALSYCFKTIDGEASFYYLALTLSDDDDKMGSLMFDDFTESEEYDEEAFTLHDSRDKTAVLKKAAELIDSGKTDECLELLQTINENSFQFTEAALARASIMMDRGELEKAIAIADEGLNKDHGHVELHTLKIMAYAELGNNEKSEECLKILDALNVKDEDDVEKVAFCMCHFDKIDLAEKYLKRLLDNDPYNKMALLCLADVFRAKGDIKGAYKYINKVCALYPEDIEAEEISERILSNDKLIMPEATIDLRSEWIGDIKDLFINETVDFTSPENVKKIKWLLKSDDDLYLQSAVCAYISQLKEFDLFLDDLLIDPFVPLVVKKQIMLRKACDENTKKMNVVVSNIFRSLKVKHPQADDKLKFAYYCAFVALASMDYKFEKRLETRFGKIKAKYDECLSEQKEKLTIDSIAALIFMRVSGATNEKTTSVFNCDRDELALAESLLGK